jgi:hypothetical protein
MSKGKSVELLKTFLEPKVLWNIVWEWSEENVPFVAD